MRSYVNAKCVTQIAKLGIMTDTPGKRLIWARKTNTAYKTATEAAQAFGWPVSTYLGHENGDRVPSRKKAMQYARRYKIRWEWILEGEGSPTLKRRAVKVMGYVGAGAEVVTFEEDSTPLGEIELPADPPANAGALIVRGQSMYPRYFDGEGVIYTPGESSPDDLIGEECVVKLTDGRIYLKILRKGSRKNLYNLESYNAPLIEDQKLEWAAPIFQRI